MLHTPTSMPSTGYQTIREQRKHTNRWKHLHRRLHRSVNEMRKYVWTRPNVSVIVLNYKKNMTNEIQAVKYHTIKVRV